jgi:type IV pilus assembly protein PilC
MPLFEYQGRDKGGQKVYGRVDARTDTDARRLLKFMGISDAKVKGAGSKSSLGTLTLPPAVEKFFQKKTVSDSDLMTFTKQLSVMIDAGVSVVKSLEILESQSTNPVMRRALFEIRSKVERGIDLSDAMAGLPSIFDNLYCSLVRSGTTSGQLDIILRRLSSYIEKNAKLKRQLFGALFYPAIVVTIAVGLTVFMLVFVVPILASTFVESGKELPELTQIIIDLSNSLRDNYLYLIAGIGLAVMAFKAWIKTPLGRYQFDGYLLRIPLVGTLVQKISIARFASTTATLVASGVSITDVLVTSKNVLGNKVLEEGLDRVREGVIQGKGLGYPMSQESFFPQMVASMVSIGEASGRLDSMLQKVSEFYEEEVDVAMSALLKAIEPAMFVVIGGIVGTILIAMYLPVFDLASIAG